MYRMLTSRKAKEIWTLTTHHVPREATHWSVRLERRTHDYKRHATTSLYVCFDILTGQVMGRLRNATGRRSVWIS
jgi:hypothetical protein